MEQHVHGGPLMVHRKALRDRHSHLHAEGLEQHVVVARSDQCQAALRPIPVGGFRHAQSSRSPPRARKATVTYLANRLSHRDGFGCEPDPVDLLPDPVCAELAIDQAWLDQTDHHAPGLVDVAKKILG